MSFTAVADVNSDMNQFFNKLGFASNTTQSGVWQGQAAGYAYGGSLYARTQVKNVQLISMTLPDINAGCGGIDAYLGSFSFINGEQLQRFVKQIMSNAAGYFFDLALQTTVPEIKTAKDFLQKMASDINSMNLSSCQAAQGIIGGLFPRTQVSQQKVCQDIAGESNIFADWAASRQGCTVGGKSDSVRDKASDKDKERVTKNINIMWNALSKNRMFDGNKELKEFVGAFYVEKGTRGIFMTTSRFHKEASKLFGQLNDIIPIDGPKLFELAKYPELALEVQNGNIAGLVVDAAVGDSIIASSDGKLVKANFTFDSEEALFGKSAVLKKGSADLLAEVNKVIEAAVADGSYINAYNEAVALQKELGL